MVVTNFINGSACLPKNWLFVKKQGDALAMWQMALESVTS